MGSLLDKSIDMFGESMRSNIPLILAKHRKREPLSDLEEERFRLFIRRKLQLFEQVYLQHREGRVSEEVMRAYSQRIKIHFAYPSWADLWPALKPLMTESFQRYVDDLEDSDAEPADEADA